VRASKESFAGHIERMTEETGSEEYRKELEQLLSPADELDGNLRSLLTELFPKIEYAYSNTMYTGHSETEWEKTYRVATSRYFDAYFQLTLAPSGVSVAAVSALIGNSGDEPSCVESLRKMAKQGRLKSTMTSLRFRLDEVPPKNLAALLAALVSIGDIASEEGAILGRQFSEYWYVRWAIFDVLDRIPEVNRPKVLQDTARRVFAPRTLVSVLALIEELRRKETKYAEFTDEALNTCRAQIVERIKSAIALGEIREVPENLSPLLYAWRHWGEQAEVTAYVQSLTDSDEKLARFLNRFVFQTHSASVKDKVMKTHNSLAMKQLSESLDLIALHERLSRVNGQKMSGENRDVIKFCLEQLNKMREAGLTPEQFDNRRSFDD